MKLLLGIIIAQAVVVLGCQSSHYTSFAPFKARLEPISSGGARHLVFVNASGQNLHNFKFSVDMWNDKNLNMRRKHTRRFYGSGPELAPGESIRFHDLGRTIETLITERISFIEMVGHCDEGDFRQAWLNNDSDQLQPVADASLPDH